MKEIELKPCPFCGGEARVYYKMDIGIPSGDNGHKVSVRCENTLRCGAKIEKWAAKKAWARNSAVEAWNRREKEMSKEKQIEELAEILRKVCDATPNGKCMSKLCCACRAESAIKAGYRKQSEGEWIDKPTGAYGRWQSWCSACGKHSGIGGIESNRHKPFCPNCGARMGGGAE